MTTIEEGDEFFVGAPAGLPEGYADSVAAVLGKDPAVRSAQLFQVYSPETDEIVVMLAVDYEGAASGLRALVDRVGPVAAPPVEEMGRGFGLVPAERARDIIPSDAVTVYVRP